MLAALAILFRAVEEQVFGQSLKQKEYCTCLRVGLTRLSLGLWGLVVFHPRLEYLGAVLGAWRCEAGRRVPWVLCYRPHISRPVRLRKMAFHIA